MSSRAIRLLSTAALGAGLAGAACSGGAGPAPTTSMRAALAATPVHVVAPGARACDLLLDVGGGRIDDVRFPDGVAGSHARRAPKLAVAVTALADAALPGVPFTIEAPAPVSIAAAEVRCVDRLGEAVAQAAVHGVGTGEVRP